MGNTASTAEFTQFKLDQGAIPDADLLTLKEWQLLDTKRLGELYADALASGNLSRNDSTAHVERETVLKHFEALQDALNVAPQRQHFFGKMSQQLQKEARLLTHNVDAFGQILDARCQLLAAAHLAFQRTLCRLEFAGRVVHSTLDDVREFLLALLAGRTDEQLVEVLSGRRRAQAQEAEDLRKAIAKSQAPGAAAQGMVASVEAEQRPTDSRASEEDQEEDEDDEGDEEDAEMLAAAMQLSIQLSRQNSQPADGNNSDAVVDVIASNAPQVAADLAPAAAAAAAQEEDQKEAEAKREPELEPEQPSVTGLDPKIEAEYLKDITISRTLLAKIVSFAHMLPEIKGVGGLLGYVDPTEVQFFVQRQQQMEAHGHMAGLPPGLMPPGLMHLLGVRRGARVDPDAISSRLMDADPQAAQRRRMAAVRRPHREEEAEEEEGEVDESDSSQSDEDDHAEVDDDHLHGHDEDDLDDDEADEDGYGYEDHLLNLGMRHEELADAFEAGNLRPEELGHADLEGFFGALLGADLDGMPNFQHHDERFDQLLHLLADPNPEPNPEPEAVPPELAAQPAERPPVNRPRRMSEPAAPAVPAVSVPAVVAVEAPAAEVAQAVEAPAPVAPAIPAMAVRQAVAQLRQRAAQ